ncbi:hypothetical protein CZ794_05380 [Psychrobacter sp. JB385]|nr:hypothetical protein CZ794_05380 [Psychrobacter sp. JB385]
MNQNSTKLNTDNISVTDKSIGLDKPKPMLLYNRLYVFDKTEVAKMNFFV